MGILDKAVNKVGGLFGLGGGQGDYYKNPALNSAASKELTSEAEMLRDPTLNGLMSDYSQGKITLQQALQGMSGQGNLSAAYGQLATSPIAGSMVASEQVRNDPLSKGLLGEGGALERALAEEKDLASRGYSLQPEDYEAYGQASGNIARMFGQQENSLAQALANRGLSAAGSGVANQQFSGLMGNKFEQLAQSQRQIADDRMKRNLERLTQTRDFTSRLGSLGQDALNSQFNRNLAGQDSRQANLRGAAGLDISKYSAEQAAAEASAKSRKENEKASLMDAIGKGAYSGVQGGISGLGTYGISTIGGKSATDFLSAGKKGVI
jgi:hypothetical protein